MGKDDRDVARISPLQTWRSAATDIEPMKSGVGENVTMGSNLDFELARFCNLVIDGVTDGVCRGHVDVDLDRHANPNGVVHGAVLFALVDTSMGAATMDALDGRPCASIDVQIRFLRPAISGVLNVETAVVRAGRRIVTLESRVTDDEDRIVVTATGAFAVLADI